jgi:hypothetical protein
VFQTLGKGIKERLVREEQKEAEETRTNGGTRLASGESAEKKNAKNKKDCC